MAAINVITLFPDLFENFREFGLVSRAVENGIVDISCTQLRDYAINTHGQVDDSPYGGGSGMVMRPESAFAAIDDAKKKSPNAKVILFTPRGKPLTQQMARKFSEQADDGFILLCSRYEGVDERIAETMVDEEICIGDYVLMGGEVPAMVFMESVIRLLPGVLGNPESIGEESFEAPLLEYPQYTKPASFNGLDVPEVLLSGNHQNIADWRKEQSVKDTQERRPDLFIDNPKPKEEVSAALIHYPVLDKQGDIITSSITTIDLSDIARSAKTFGIDRLYIVHPGKTLRRLAEKINEHWFDGYGAEYNPDRKEALSLLSIVSDIDDMILDIEERTGKLPNLVTTSARPTENSISYGEYRKCLASVENPQVILFGTGWGLAEEVMSRAQTFLEPIDGFTGYNHLSVRSAAAITFWRILGNMNPKR